MTALLTRLGELLGVRTDEVEAVLRHDERRAQSTVRMQRRGFLGAAAALAAAPFVPATFVEVPELGLLSEWVEYDYDPMPHLWHLTVRYADSARAWVAP